MASHYIINDVASNNVLGHPLGKSFGGDYPIVQYDNDTLIILPADEQQLIALKNIFYTYASSTGLKVNFQKSSLIPIIVEPQKASSLATAIGCQVGEMPFTYLGLPLGTTRPTIQEYLPLMNKIERRMMGINKLLSYSGGPLKCIFIVVMTKGSTSPPFSSCNSSQRVDQSTLYPR